MESELSRVVDALPGFVWTASPDGQIEFFNRRWCDHTGLALDQSRGRGWQAAIHPEDLTGLLAGWQNSPTRQATIESEARVRGSDGRYRRYRFRADPTTDASGRVTKWCGLAIDIDARTAERPAEAERESERRSLQIVSSVPGVVIFFTTPDGRHEVVSPQMMRYFGKTLEELRHWATDGTVHPEDRAQAVEIFSRAIASGEPYKFEARFRRHDGVYQWFQCRGRPRRDEAGRIVRWHCVGIDIDERKQAEEALRASEARRASAERDLQLMIDTIPVFVAAYEPDGTRSFVNRTWQDYMGLTLDEACGVGAKSFSHFHPDDTGQNDKAWQASLASGEPLSVEVRVRRHDGQYRWHSSRRVPLRDEKGSIVRWYSVGTDIDDQKAAEAALRQSEARLAETEREVRLTLDSIPTMTWRAGPTGRVLAGNKRWFDYTGSAPDQVANGQWQTFVHQDDLETLLAVGKPNMPDGKPTEAEARVRRHDGVYRWFLFRVEPARDESGQIFAWYGTITDIEDKKRAEDALHRSEEQLKTAQRELQLTIDTIPMKVATYKPDGTRSFVNQQWRNYVNLTLEEATAAGQQVPRHFHPDDSERAERVWRHALATGEPLSHDMRIRRADGEYRWHSHQCVALRDDQGKIVKWYAAEVDIEDKKRAEDALRRSEAQLQEAQRELQLTIDSLPVLVASYRADGTRIFINQTWQSYTGLTPQEVTSPAKTAFPHFHPDDVGPLERAIQASLASGEPLPYEVRLRRADGEYRWHFVRRVPVRDENGAIIRWYSTGFDIHDKKVAEDALRKSEAELKEAQRELQLTIDTIPALVATYRPDGSRIFINQMWQTYTGFTQQQATGDARTAFPHFHPDEIETIVRGIRASNESGEPFAYEARVSDASGVYRWHTFRRVPLRDDNGDIIRWFATGFDIHDKKLAEDALRHSEAQLAQTERELRLMLDSIPTITWRGSPKGYVQYINKRWYEYTGTTPEQSQGDGWQSCVHPNDLEALMATGNQYIPTGQPTDAEARLRRYDGEYRWFLFRPAAARDENGKVVAWFGIVTDIEDRKRAEQALQRSESRLAGTERELRVTLDSIPTMTWRASANGYVQSLNKRWFEYTGSTYEQVQDNGWRSFIHPDDLSALADSGRQNIPVGTPVDVEGRLRRHDGEYRWFLFRVEPVRDDAGAIAGWYGTITDIEDRKCAEDALQESQVRLAEAEREARFTLDSIPTIAWRGGANGYVQALNKRWFEYTGTTPEQMHGARWKSCVHPDDIDQLVKVGVEYVTSGNAIDSEARLRRHDGEYRWFLFRPALARDNAGNIIGWYGSIIDIEDRKRAEERVIEAGRELQRTIDTIPARLGIYSADGTRTGANKRVIEVTGDWRLVLHPDDVEPIESRWRECVAKGEPFECEYRSHMVDGTYRWHLARRVPVRDEAGTIIRWYGIGTDIEDRKRAEQALAASERNLQVTIDTIPAQAWSAHVDGSIEFLNQHYIDYVGLSPEEVQEVRFLAIHPDDFDELVETWRIVRESGQPGEAEARLRRHDGEYRWFLMRVSPLRNEAGDIVKWYGVNTDIEDRRRVEEELGRSETFLLEGQRISSTGSFSWRVDTDELKFSDELWRIFEFEPGAVITFEQVFARVHPEDAPVLSERMNRVRAGGGSVEQEIRLRMPDGRIKYLRTVGQMIHHQDGRSEYLGAIQDVTQRRTAEEMVDKVRSELAHVTRVMSLGALTASIAHEVNQPLAGIVTNASTCLRMLAADPPNVDGARETARRTIRDGNRAADVIARLRALFSKKPTVSETVDLNDATREVVALVFSDLMRNRVALRVELDDDLPPLVTGDRVQLQQVILNLVRNASDAMSAVDDRPRELTIKIDEHDNQVRLTVTDTGAGFELQGTERLFDAFYTTKSDGMGIGLSVSRSIIETHGGTLRAEPNDGPGASFSFSIPRQDSSAGVSGIPSAILTRPTRGAHDPTRNA